MLNKGLYLISLSGCACGAALGQGTTSRVLGTVQDASGAVVPAATVKLVNEGTRITFTTTTSSAGSYVFEAVQPGSYELDVEAAGFRNFVSRGNDVAIGQPATINLKLDIGAGQFGNTGRNMFVGPYYFELNASLLKRIPITERFKLELRADGTNITNSVSFNAPTVDITNSTFGRIRNSVASGSRKIQIGAKIHS